MRPGSLTILGRVHLEFALAGAVAPWCLLALGEQVADCLLALPYLLLLLLERFRVQELAALAGFAAELGLGGQKATGSAACKAREKRPCLAYHGLRSVLSECSVGLENSRRVQLKVEAQLPSLSHAHTAQAGLLPTCSISNGYSDASLATSAAAPSSRRRHQLVLFISSLFSAPALRRSIATATELPRIAVH